MYYLGVFNIFVFFLPLLLAKRKQFSPRKDSLYFSLPFQHKVEGVSSRSLKYNVSLHPPAVLSIIVFFSLSNKTERCETVT